MCKGGVSATCVAIGNQPVGLGFAHLAGRYRLGGSALSSPGRWSCRDMERSLTRGWELILPGCGRTSALSRGATLAACWLYEPLPISNQPVGLGFAHPAGRYRPGGSAFMSPGCWSCRDMEVFLHRGMELILTGCGGTSALAQGATLAARWFHERQPISNHPVGLGIPHPAGRCRPGGSVFSTLSARLFHEPQPISDQPAGLSEL